MPLVTNLSSKTDSSIQTNSKAAPEIDMSMISYDSNSAKMDKLAGIDELMKYKDASGILWLNINGLENIGFIKQVGDFYNIHPLTIEDIIHTEQQPKLEIFDEYKYLSIKTIQREKKFQHKQRKAKKSFFFSNMEEEQKDDENEIEEFLIDQISVIIMKNMIITFQQIPGDSFDGIRKKILEGIGKTRKLGTDFLTYEIIDSVVDEYLLTINHLEDDIEDFEGRAAKTTSGGKFIEEIQDTKKSLLQIKRAIAPLKDIILIIIHREKFFKTDEFKPFLQDLIENLNNALVTLENHREWLSNIMDVNLSVLSYQTNSVMKVLTVISTIFIPLTFLAGVYGMNFEYMPELKYALGYPAVLGGMGLIASMMIIIFKIRHWF